MTKPEVQVDILTPVYGHPELFAQCVISLLDPAKDPGVSFHWWVIDDAGPQTPRIEVMGHILQPGIQDIYEWLESDPRCTVIRSKKNHGFAGANNIAAARGKAPYILLLNSDTRVRHAGWLKTMVQEAAADRVGAVGPMLLFFEEDTSDPEKRPAGKVQHCGVVFNIIGQPYHLFMGWSKDHPRVNQRRDKLQAVTGACLLTRRRWWSYTGGLDETYGQGNFEDVQYCKQLNASGLKIIFTPEVELDHFHGGSNNSDVATKNQTIFQLKAGDLVICDDFRYL